MTLEEACKKIEAACLESNTFFDCSSQDIGITNEKEIPLVSFRADVGYIYTGPWEESLSKALIGLAEML